MPVNKEQIAQYVAELGLPQDQTETLVTTLLGNEQAAVQFVGQRLRHEDYTRKTQELSQHKNQIEQSANQQITAYAQQLQAAQERIASIMTDMEKEHISAATANARLRKVKETFNLSDADIPQIEGVEKPAGTGNPDKPQPGIDIDKKLDAFGRDLLRTIRQDMLSLPQVTAIQADISDQHRELTGKRLSRSEMNDLLNDAREKKVTLEQAWEQKFGIPDLRMQKRDEENKSKWKGEWEAEQKKRFSDEALSGVRRPAPEQSSFQSPVLRKQFNGSDPAPPAQTGQSASSSQQAQPPAQPTGGNGHRLSGAERAAAKFLERRNAGVPMGAPQSTQPSQQ